LLAISSKSTKTISSVIPAKVKVNVIETYQGLGKILDVINSIHGQASTSVCQQEALRASHAELLYYTYQPDVVNYSQILVFGVAVSMSNCTP